ncbi:hypothetical protein CEXT_451741 [Caerostris extrusa]|uniref:Uncharacterized protein n=1 Tax=Caerostris extrusa TaxID=172846 RepID=A0AAV4TKU1_CAEEX|nr:hypothetical protein CEXT_451741 [Caerostris extrusa]
MNEEVTEPPGGTSQAKVNRLIYALFLCHQNFFFALLPQRLLALLSFARHPFPYALRHNTVPCFIRYLYRITSMYFCMVEEQIAYGRREKMGAEIPLPRGRNQERKEITVMISCP